MPVYTINVLLEIAFHIETRDESPAPHISNL